MKLLALVLFLCSFSAKAEVYGLELSHFKMSYSKIDNNRDPYFPTIGDPGGDKHEFWDYSVDTTFGLDLFRYNDFLFHWQNRIHGDATNVQFRQTGWEFAWGLKYKRVEFLYEHHSRHCLECKLDDKYKFPLENRYTLEVTFYERDKK